MRLESPRPRHSLVEPPFPPRQSARPPPRAPVPPPPAAAAPRLRRLLRLPAAEPGAHRPDAAQLAGRGVGRGDRDSARLPAGQPGDQAAGVLAGEGRSARSITVLLGARARSARRLSRPPLRNWRLYFIVLCYYWGFVAAYYEEYLRRELIT